MSFRHPSVFFAALSALLGVILLGTERTRAQSMSGSAATTGCAAGQSCPGAAHRGHRRIGARLRLLRDIVRTAGLDAAVFGPEGAPDDVTEESVGALLRFRSRLTDGDLRQLRAIGVQLERDGRGAPIRTGTVYLARIPWTSFSQLAEYDRLVRAESTWAPGFETPLDVTGEAVGAGDVRRIPDLAFDGDGVVIGDIDSGFNIFHPHMFRADGGWYRWLDSNQNGSFDAGADGVDLDDDGAIGPSEELEVLDGTVVRRGRSRDNDDGRLQPRRDWLYVDANGDDTRNVGPANGFDESDPAYGEPIFVADDADRDGVLEPVEKLVRLDSSKFKRIRRQGRDYERGEDLIQIGVPGEGARVRHGTGVVSILAGGQPRFHDRVGLAPGADIVGYPYLVQRGNRGNGRFGSIQRYVSDAVDSNVDILLHEWTDIAATPQDGSTNLEQSLDAARNNGIVQVNPLGNLNLAEKHIEKRVDPGDTPTLSFQVDDEFRRGRRSREYTYVMIGLRWRASQTPDFELKTPGGKSLSLETGGSRQTIGPYNVAARSDLSPRGTHHLTVTVWNRQTPLTEGVWSIQARNVTKRDELVGRLTDRLSSWGVGIRWTNPTRGEGTVTFPATADSAFGVAAYGGRRTLKRYGPVSKPGELRHYSGRGPRIDGAPIADIAAPDDPLAAFGVNARWRQAGYGRSWFRHFGGTSGAGPHVAAAFAILKERQPGATPQRVETQIVDAADSNGLTPRLGGAPNRGWGYGKLDIYEAVTDEESAPPDNAAPDAELEVVRQGTQYRVDASESRDPDGDDLQFRFDYDYDGTWETAWGPTSTRDIPEETFGEPGTYRLRVAVTDPHGHRAGAVERVDVRPTVEDGGGGETGPDAGADSGTSPDAATPATSDVADPSIQPVPSKPEDEGCSGCSATGGGAPMSLGLVLLVLFGLRRPDD